MGRRCVVLLGALPLLSFAVISTFQSGVWEGWVISSPHLCTLWSLLSCLRTVLAPGQEGRKWVRAGRGQAPGSRQKKGKVAGAPGKASLLSGSRDAR